MRKGKCMSPWPPPPIPVSVSLSGDWGVVTRRSEPRNGVREARFEFEPRPSRFGAESAPERRRNGARFGVRFSAGSAPFRPLGADSTPFRRRFGAVGTAGTARFGDSNSNRRSPPTALSKVVARGPILHKD